MKILQALLVLWIHLRLIQSAGVKADLEHPNVTLTKVAFGSCHKSKYPSSEQWRRIREEKAQAWLWLGDAVYPPMRNIAPVESLQEQYRSLKENPDYAALLASTPFVYGTWDDHDYGGNDMGKRMPDKREKRDAFLEFVGGPSLVDREGVYHSVSFGSPPHQVKIILIDTRYHRDDHCLPSVATQFALGAGIACATRWLAAGLLPTFCGTGGSMLGEEQWSWLEREISDSSAAVHIVASSVQVLSTNPVGRLSRRDGHFDSNSHSNSYRLLLTGHGGMVSFSFGAGAFLTVAWKKPGYASLERGCSLRRNSESSARFVRSDILRNHTRLHKAHLRTSLQTPFGYLSFASL
jgi:alkaline phosphatase D